MSDTCLPASIRRVQTQEDLPPAQWSRDLFIQLMLLGEEDEEGEEGEVD